jgi:hypothetical protein
MNHYETIAWDKVGELTKQIEELREMVKTYETVLASYAQQVCELREFFARETQND